MCVWSNEHRFPHSDFFFCRTGSLPCCALSPALISFQFNRSPLFFCLSWILYSLYRIPFIFSICVRLKSVVNAIQNKIARAQKNAFSVIAISYPSNVVYHFFLARLYHHLSFVIVVVVVVFITFILRLSHDCSQCSLCLWRRALFRTRYCYHLMTPNNKREMSVLACELASLSSRIACTTLNEKFHRFNINMYNSTNLFSIVYDSFRPPSVSLVFTITHSPTIARQATGAGGKNRPSHYTNHGLWW